MTTNTGLGIVLAISLIFAWGCTHSEQKVDKNKQSSFTVDDAKQNLTFASEQYLKMIDSVVNKRNLAPKPNCKSDSSMICVPRSEEHNAIFMEEKEKWTNGFFPGLLWKLLSSQEHIENWDPEKEKTLFDTAKYYQNTLFSEAHRGTTHDLGFILYDSFGEALLYHKLDDELRKSYTKVLDTGRATLASRYGEEFGLIRSWDWVPNMKIPVQYENTQAIERYELSQPWQYPVIVDNMMNLEFLLSSKEQRHHEIAFNHAKQTLEHHYFYDDADKEQKYPLAYHVYDYDSQRPGNWQGVGNVSAWARGQGWSLYGYVTIVEALQQTSIDLSEFPDFKGHLEQLLDSIEYLLKDDVVPYWDFFANRPNAFEYAENVSSNTTIYSGILGLCNKRIERYIKPYNGYRPIMLDASLLTSESLQALEGKVNWHGENILQGDKLNLCGSQSYPETHTRIPKDTSAASIYAAALYRYAQYTSDEEAKLKYASLADKIMRKLSDVYRVDRTEKPRENSFALGFVLAHATGDMGNAGEIDTPIIYGDFYFIEANIRKIEYQTGIK